MYTSCNLLCNVVHPTWLNIFRTWSYVCGCAFHCIHYTEVFDVSRLHRPHANKWLCIQPSPMPLKISLSLFISLFIFNISIGRPHTSRSKRRSFISSVLTFYFHVLKNWWHIFHPWFTSSGFINPINFNDQLQ